jgi:hypothetical protein
MNDQREKPGTAEALRELRADALIGKRKHYNAADRVSRRNTTLTICAVIADIIAGSVLLSLLATDLPAVAKVVGGVAALVAAVAVGLQKSLKLSEAAAGHRVAGRRYLSLAKRVRRLALFDSDTPASTFDVQAGIGALGAEYDEITEMADAWPTSEVDYRRAVAGIEAGEEQYTDKELGLTASTSGGESTP